MRTDPIIILGMHRSGTSLMAQLLEHCGLYIGHDLLPPFYENRFYLEANDRLLKSVGASWSSPWPVVYQLCSNPEALASGIQSLLGQVETPRFEELYLSEAARQRFYEDPSFTWGWKDPRVMLLLPLWRQVYPNARYVLMVRNGVDVTQSLLVRNKQLFTRQNPGYESFTKLRDALFLEWFPLWEYYHQIFYDVRWKIPDLPVIEVRFESLMSHPHRELSRVLAFTGLNCPPETLHTAVADIRAERSLAFTQDTMLVDFYHQVRERWFMRHFKYNQFKGPL